MRSLTQKEAAKVPNAVEVFGMDTVSHLHVLYDWVCMYIHVYTMYIYIYIHTCIILCIIYTCTYIRTCMYIHDCVEAVEVYIMYFYTC